MPTPASDPGKVPETGSRLRPCAPGPSGVERPRVIIDTDTANEIDDQFAVAWSLLSDERMALEGVAAEPFSFAHHREGLIKSTGILERGGPANAEEERFMGGLGGWAARLVEQGISATDIAFVGTEEGRAALLRGDPDGIRTLRGRFGRTGCFAARHATWARSTNRSTARPRGSSSSEPWRMTGRSTSWPWAR